MVLLFWIMRCTPTIRELIVATPLQLSSRLTTGLSALERSDFVLWPDADLLVQRQFLRRLLGVKQTRYAQREFFRV